MAIVNEDNYRTYQKIGDFDSINQTNVNAMLVEVAELEAAGENEDNPGGSPTPPVPPTLPTVITNAITSILTTTATGGGNVTSDGNATVTAKGVCWSTITGATTGNSHTIDGTGKGAFVSSLTGLTPNTLYYVRAYATNSVGTAYGAEVSFTTLPSYPLIMRVSVNSGDTVTIPHQEYDIYSNPYTYNYFVDYGDGSPIVHVTLYNDPNCTHTYSGTSAYTIQISGTCETIYCIGSRLEPYLIEITSWGSVGLKAIDFFNCILLTSIPDDTYGGLALITDFTYTFQNCPITSIPAHLFDYCTGVTSFNTTFSYCPIASIPTGLFDKNTLVTDFYGTFQDCSALTSIPDELFSNCTLAITFESTFSNCSH